MKNEVMPAGTYRESYVHLKKDFRTSILKMTLNRMVAHNLTDLIDPQKWTAQCSGWSWMEYRAKEGTTIADLDRLAKKLSKIWNCEPQKEISTNTIWFRWWAYPTNGREIGKLPSVMVEFVIVNSEKCDFIETTVTETRYEPTGYCKALKERHYLPSMEPATI